MHFVQDNVIWGPRFFFRKHTNLPRESSFAIAAIYCNKSGPMVQSFHLELAVSSEFLQSAPNDAPLGLGYGIGIY